MTGGTGSGPPASCPGSEPRTGDVLARNACRNCRRPIEYLRDIGWCHGETSALYAKRPMTCTKAAPVEWHCPACGQPRPTSAGALHRVDAHRAPDGGRCPGSRQPGQSPLRE